MCFVERAVLADHLRFNPETKLHAFIVASLNDRSQSIGKFLWIHFPIAQRSLVIGTTQEPAIIQYKTLDPERCCLIDQRQHRGLIDTKIERLPGIQLHGTPCADRVLACNKLAPNHLMPLPRQSVLPRTAMAEVKRGARVMRAGSKRYLTGSQQLACL